MKSVEIEVLCSRAALQAFTRTWRQAERGETATSRIAFGSWAEVFSAITEKRLELVRHVLGHERMNTRQIAQALGRDYKNCLHGRSRSSKSGYSPGIAGAGSRRRSMRS